MILRHVSITDFKNIAEASIDFCDKLNCMLGDNGMGKSNLLDAIYVLSYTKSFAGTPDNMLIRRGCPWAHLHADYLRHDAEDDINVVLSPGHKSFKRGGKEYRRLSSHIGLFPAVLVSPSDMNLVSGAAEVRRRFIDMVISQVDSHYLEHLIRYNRALEQRNRMLKDSSADFLLFDTIEAGMDISSRYIIEARRCHIRRLAELHHRYYGIIAGDSETVTMDYRGPLDGTTDASIADALSRNRDRDRLLGYTAMGIHRDDVDVAVNGLPLRRTASQGQAKTFTIALRMAQYRFLVESTRLKPLLLLDDIFDKLDATRVSRIIALVASEDFGQIFITDTNRRHLDEIPGHLAADAPCRMWRVTDGTFEQLP